MHFPQLAFFVTLLAAVAVSALPWSGRRLLGRLVLSNGEGDHLRRDNTTSFQLKNGQDAQALNRQFQNLTVDSPCQAGQDACVGGDFAQCVCGKFVTTACGPTLKCFALPLVKKPGTSITCDTEEDAISRIAETGATGGLTGQ